MHCIATYCIIQNKNITSVSAVQQETKWLRRTQRSVNNMSTTDHTHTHTHTHTYIYIYIYYVNFDKTTLQTKLLRLVQGSNFTTRFHAKFVYGYDDYRLPPL
jgi:hypothetical protein